MEYDVNDNTLDHSFPFILCLSFSETEEGTRLFATKSTQPFFILHFIEDVHLTTRVHVNIYLDIVFTHLFIPFLSF